MERKKRLNVLTKQEIIFYALKHGILAFDIEYDPHKEDGNERHYSDLDFDIHGCSFAVIKNSEVYSTYFTSREDIQEIIDATFQHCECWGWFTKFDYTCLKQAKYNLPLNFNIRDGAKALCLLDEDRMKYGLKIVTPEILEYELNEFSADDLDSPEFFEYAAEDTVATLELAMRFKPQLEEHGLIYVFDLISPASIVFGDMERRGIHWDLETGEEIHNKFVILRDEIESQIYSLIGRININSPKQLAHRLFNELGYTAPNLEMTKTGQISTAEGNIEKLAERYPVCELIAAHRTCSKMISSYIEPFTLHSVYYDDSRMHTRFGFLLKTGRTSAVSPPVQTVPSKPLGQKIKFNERLKAYLNDIKLRSGFTPPEGRALIVRDFSSLEYRTAAVAAPEPKLIEMYKAWECNECGACGSDSKVVDVCPECLSEDFKQGKDLHARNRDIANIFEGVDINRQDAKALSFLSIFYGTAWKLHKDLNVPYKVAEQILSQVFDEFADLRKWHQRTEKILRRDGVRDGQGREMTQGEVRCIFGRRRKVDIEKVRKQVFAKAKSEGLSSEEIERKIKGAEKNLANMLINFPCQSPACTIGLIALNKFRNEIIKRGWYDIVWIVNFVHDEICAECPVEMVDEVNELLKYCMENAINIGVPLPTEGGVARFGDLNEAGKQMSWADIK